MTSQSSTLVADTPILIAHFHPDSFLQVAGSAVEESECKLASCDGGQGSKQTIELINSYHSAKPFERGGKPSIAKIFNLYESSDISDSPKISLSDISTKFK